MSVRFLPFTLARGRGARRGRDGLHVMVGLLMQLAIGTLDDPIMVNSFGDEQYCGCTGCPADSHSVKWLTVSPDNSFPFPSLSSSRPCLLQKECPIANAPHRSPAAAPSSAALNAGAAIRWNTSGLTTIHMRMHVRRTLSFCF